MQALARRLATAPRGPWPDRPVPIALVITELDVGGAETALVALATGLDRARWEPSVIGLGPEGPLAAPLRAAGIDVECLDVGRRNPAGAVLRLARALRRRRPRLVQSFLFHANIAARLAAPLAGVPWVVGGLRVAERQQRWHLTVDRLTARLSAGSVCVSPGVMQFSREVGGLPVDRLAMIANGIDPGPIDRAAAVPRSALGVPEGHVLALFVGRLDRQKGVDVLLEAAGPVVSARPDWSLLVVGDGPEGARMRDRVAADRALGERVRLLGRRDDVPGLLKAADLLVLPSRWEGMPNVVLEAMAARRPVVATRVEGSEDLVEPGRTGWLVPPDDPGALAGALLDAAADPDRAFRFGQEARRCVERAYTQEQVIASYSRLWARLLGLEWGTGDGGQGMDTPADVLGHVPPPTPHPPRSWP